MAEFIGRSSQLRALNGLLDRVARGGSKPGRALLMRGRRRVGKSRLVEEFIDRTGVPAVFFTASKQSVGDELRLFAEEVVASNLPGASLFTGLTPTSWDGALQLLAAALPSDAPSIVVIDELPYLTESSDAFEGTLQKIFDRDLSNKPVLLIGIGSDLAMMEALNDYGRPFHQRATEMVVPALSPHEVADMLDLEPAEAFDAYLVTGGLPLILDEWDRGSSMAEFLGSALASPTSALLVSGERALAAEFPAETQARTVLGTIGAGERTFTNIGREAGGLQQTSLSRSLTTLTRKRVVAAERPLSTTTSTDTRYRVADPYLRFWLAFLGPSLPEIERGRGDRVLARIEQGWSTWRGRAIEPVLREALDRLPPAEQPAGGGAVGAYWTRTNVPEIDVVIADRAPVAKEIRALGSIKWHDEAAFDRRDRDELIAHRAQMPGASPSTPLFAISRNGSTVSDLETYDPERLLRAWAGND